MEKTYISVKALMESYLIDYFKQVTNMVKDQPQGEYWQWKLKNAHEVHMTPSSEIGKLYPEIGAYLKRGRDINLKDCYRNAGKLATIVDGVEYVEGEVSYSGIPIEHAWNKIGDKYFDITKDVVLEGHSPFDEYVAIIELGPDQLYKFMGQYKHWGGWLYEEFSRQTQKDQKKAIPRKRAAVHESWLNESPDMIKYNGKIYSTGDKDAYSFVCQLNTRNKVSGVSVANRPGLTHSANNLYGRYTGRLFLGPKVIAFWTHPKKTELVGILSMLEKKLMADGIKVNFMGNREWRIEIFGEINQDAYDFHNIDFEYRRNLTNAKFPIIEDYIRGSEQSENAPEEEYAEHQKSPLLKSTKAVTPGFGSKHPDAPERFKKEMRNAFESQSDEFYPPLNENPNAINVYKIFPENDNPNAPENVIDWNVGRNTFAFGWDEDEKEFKCEEGNTHFGIFHFFKNSGRGKHSGRMFADYKVLSFWDFPKNSDELFDVIKRIKNITGYDILEDTSWRVEIPTKEENPSPQWGSWFPENKDIKYVPVYDYHYPGERPKEELEQEHVKSPLLKGKREVPKGFGSKHPDAEKKFKEKMDAPFESFYPKLNENPDELYYKGWTYEYYKNDAIPFGAKLKDGKIDDITIGSRGEMHKDAGIKEKRWDDVKYAYSGRLFLSPKIITFWTYPNKEELMFIIKTLEKKLNFSIFNSGWQIEVYEDMPTGELDFEFRYQYKINRSSFISIDEYLKSNIQSANAPKEEYEEHLKSPLLKKTKDVPSGFGSKNPNASARFKEKMNAPFESLNESPDQLHVDWDTPQWKSYAYNANAKPFAVKENNGKIGIVKVGNLREIHMDSGMLRRNGYVYPGRLFFTPKVITFWSYPNKTELVSIIKMLEEILNIKIFNNEWRIEIYDGLETGALTYADPKLDTIHEESHLVSIDKYIQDDNLNSKDAPDEEYQEHLKSPLLKKDKNVPFGFGSKHPKAPARFKEKMEAPYENKTEDFYPVLSEGVGDKYLANKFYIPDEEEEFEKKFKSKKLEASSDVIVYRWPKINHDDYDSFIVKNPSSFKNFDYAVRGVIMANGDLYMMNNHRAIHNGFIKKLIELGIIEDTGDNARQWHKLPPKDFVTVQRVDDTNSIVMGESNEMLYSDENREKHLPAYQKITKAGQLKNPQFHFYADDALSLIQLNPNIVFESDKRDEYLEKRFGIKRELHEIPIFKKDIIAIITDGVEEDVPIFKNPKSLNGYDKAVRAISDEEGNLYVAMQNRLFNHGMMGTALAKAGAIKIHAEPYNELARVAEDSHGIYEDQEHFLLLNRMSGTTTFITSDIFRWVGGETERMIKALKAKNPQFGYMFPTYDEDYDEIDESLNHLNETPDQVKIEGTDYYIFNSHEWDVHDWDIEGAYPFGYYNNEFLVGDESRSHENIFQKLRVIGGDRHSFKYPGRIWTKQKLISFWKYPTTQEDFKQFAADLANTMGIDIMNDPNYRVEIIKNPNLKNTTSAWTYSEQNWDIAFVHPSDFIGSEDQSKEAFDKAHVLSPLLKKSKEVPKGFGSKHPDAEKKFKEKMDTPFESFYPKLNETPDSYKIEGSDYYDEWEEEMLYDAHTWAVEGTMPFGYITGYTSDKFYIGNNRAKHTDIQLPGGNKSRSAFKYAGRIWTKEKMISFWEYPDKKMFKKFADDLLHTTGINIMKDPEYKIEVLLNPNKDSRDYAAKDWQYMPRVKQEIAFISPKDYAGSEELSAEDKNIEHAVSPLLKKSKEVPKGFGSKHPDAEKKFKEKIDAPFESFYPKLNETPEIQYVNKVEYNWDTAYPFGVNEDGFIMGNLGGIHQNIEYGDFKYAGRIWPDLKILSFWEFPDTKMFKVILGYLQDHFDKERANDNNPYNRYTKKPATQVNLKDPNWRVEVLKDNDTKNIDFENFAQWSSHGYHEEHITFDEYVGSGKRSEEELNHEHIISPLLKAGKEVPKGFGSKHPKAEQKFKEKMDAPFESFYPKLNETPDSLTVDGEDYEYSDDIAVPFSVTLKRSTLEIADVLVGKPGLSHGGAKVQFYAGEDYNFYQWYHGRLFLTPKVITFWKFPKKPEMVKIIHIIEDRIDQKIFANGWRIEFYDDDYFSTFVNIDEYLKSEIDSKDAPEEDYLEHLKSPLLKKQKEVPFGFGSKHPKAEEMTKKKIKAPFESKDENLYPRLFENPDTIFINGYRIDYEEGLAFGYYNGVLGVSKPREIHYDIFNPRLTDES